MMISPPGFVLRATLAESDVIEGHPEWHERVAHVVSHARNQAETIARLPEVRWTIESALPPHSGLGSGTQLSLAIAAALSRLAGEPDLSGVELARRAGRGARSAIGIHGFRQGGFLVEGGKRPGQDVSPLVSRVPVPEDWRFVLIRPRDAVGLSGAEELKGFASLPPMAAHMTDRLCRLALLELIPALIESDFDHFGEALFEFGQIVGSHFAPVQGGNCADSRMRELLPILRARGVGGVGQSSWGPTLFALCRNETEARQLVAELSTDPVGSSCELTVAAPLNYGALLQ